MKKLNELYDCNIDVEISDIKINSKEVLPGDLFVCTMGVNADRHDFIEEAVENGASAIVVSKDVNFNIPTIKVEDTNKELPLVASKFYDHPENSLDLIAVTGTNGKTTVCSMIQDLIGKDICGYMGTNGLICEKFTKTMRNTTPDSDRLYKYFKEFTDSGCKYLSMETSSEAFFRNRLDNLKFKIGIMTNITEDHLNIHKTIENYVSSKQRIMDHISDDGYMILNTDDKYYESCKEKVKGNLLTYGLKESTLQIISYEVLETKTNITYLYEGKEYKVKSPALGDFNVYNLSAAILALIGLGYSMEKIIERVKEVSTPPGRLQFLNYGQEFKIILDYAHTPDAFSKLYPFLQKIKKGKIITVTGSAGGRDKEKRGPMGKIVIDNSDRVIFTMDDPRHESVDDITDDLVSLSDKKNYDRVKERDKAIYRAFNLAEKDDIVLIAGKGTDDYMAIGDHYELYSDLTVIESYFR